MALEAVMIEQWLVLYEEREQEMQTRQLILRLEPLISDSDYGFHRPFAYQQSYQ